ncbi:MAG: hypothetical protein KDI19_00150 [Pseudomonadales bacterium]|nr:hypothetical protein [Pseudomonadales bacterium]
MKSYNRAREDVGNIILLEHVNVTVPDQGIATFFYVTGLGLTRDPFVDFGPFNVWVNCGEQQFHLPTAAPQVLRGHVGVVAGSLDDLQERLGRVARRLEGTRFSWTRSPRHLEVTCPWGNRIRCFEPGKYRMPLGIAYVEFDVPRGSAQGIARFYNDVIGAPAIVKRNTCEVAVGRGQSLRFHETTSRLPDYDGHHIAVYVTDFSAPHRELSARGLITEESDEHQYRFTSIFDPATGDTLYELEHEVRSLYHPMYARHLTNRNPAQSFGHYVPGRDRFVP